MPKQYTIKARIEGEDAFSPAARSAARSIEDLVSGLEKLGVEGEAARRFADEFSAGLSEGAREAAKAGDAIEKAGESVGKANSFFDAFINEIGSRFVVTAGDAANAIFALASAITSSIDAASESEQSLRGVANALADLGPVESARVTRALREQADALQATTAFSADAINRGQALAASYVKTREELEALTDAAADLASGRGIDIGTAFEALTKASQGSTDALSRYGIVIDDTIPKSEVFAAVLARVNELFGGRATADSQTYAGSIARVSNAFSELQAALGRNVTESGAVRQTLNDLTTILNLSADAAEQARTGQDTFAASISKVSDFAIRASGPLANLVATFKQIQEARAAASALEALAEQSSRIAVNASGLERVGAAVRAMGEEATRVQNPLERFLLDMENLRLETDRLAAAQERFRTTSSTFGTGLDAAAKPVLDFDQAIADLQTRFDAGDVTLQEYLAEYDALKTSFETGTIAAERAAAATERQGEASARAASNLRSAADANRELADETERGATAIGESTGSLDAYIAALLTRLVPALSQVQQQAAQTRAEVSGIFDRSGDELPAGGELILGGTRYNLPGGGSRLVDKSRSSGSGVTTSPFSGRFLVNTPQYGTIEAFKVSSYGFGNAVGGTTTYGVLPGGRIVQLSER